MKKSKVVLIASCIFSIVFLAYIFKMSRDLSRVEDIIASSPNVVDVTDKIQTKLLVTAENMKSSEWTANSYDDSKWTTVKIPKHRIITEKSFMEDNIAYYRIYISKESFEKLKGLENELSISLQYVQFWKMDIYVNGVFLRTSRPKKAIEYITTIPIDHREKSIISIKGYIKSGDTGINHRGRILIGKSEELNELYGKSYKLITVFGLIFILCKGSILLILSLIFLVLEVDRFFEKSLLFAMFVIMEDIVISDYVTGIINFNQQLILYNTINLCLNFYLFLFLSDVVNKKNKTKKINIIFFSLLLVSSLISIDVLYYGRIFNVDSFLRFWNCIFILNLIIFLPRLYNKEKVLFAISIIALVMTSWSTVFSGNVGHNLKAFGSLLIFFGVAYQTFILFRREQLLLFEQEKDVAIGKTAAILAHDVRRPLEQMAVMLDQLGNIDITSEMVEISKKDIEFSLNSVRSQINDIMNFSRTENLSLTEISFYSLLSSSIKQVLFLRTDSRISLEYNFQVSHYVIGDYNRLTSVLGNLIENAIDAIEVLGKCQNGTLKFATKIENKKFVFSIFNDGPIIPQEIITRIFEPLFTSGKSKGTGLGLASAQKVIIDHGGEIKARNINGDGVEFSFDLQISNSLDDWGEYEFKSSNFVCIPKTQSLSLREDKKQFRVFLLDPDKYSYDYIKSLASDLGHDVEITYSNNYIEGEKLIRSKRFDLYLIENDIGEQGKGIDFYEKNLSFLSREVFFYSNLTVQHPYVSFLSKPVSKKILSETIMKINESKKEILLVEDSKVISVAWLMFHGKHNLVSVSSPEEAIALIVVDSNRFDMIVLDYYYDNSQMNGEELAKRIVLLTKAKIIISSSRTDLKTEFTLIAKNFYDVRALKK